LDIASEFRLDLQHGTQVKINHEMVQRYEKHLRERLGERRPFDWRNPDLFLEDSEGKELVSQFFAVGNSINFRYWSRRPGGAYCEGRKGGEDFRGANYMWRCLKVCHDNGEYPILEAKSLARIGLSDARAIFRSDSGKNVMPAVRERVLNWRDLGRKLNDYWSGCFFNLVEEVGKSLRLFVNFSRQFRAFDDALCKMTMVNAIMHSGRKLISFDESIFPGMDYELLKQQMRNGILELNKNLRAKITGGKLLSPAESRQLRNAGLAAFLDIMKGTSIAGDILDNVWWSNRTKCETYRPVCKVEGKQNECFFYGICPERVEYSIPLEITRYY